jgi:hypothetical protein
MKPHTDTHIVLLSRLHTFKTYSLGSGQGQLQLLADTVMNLLAKAEYFLNWCIFFDIFLCLILLLFMSMGWDYTYELWPLTGLLFIPQMTYENGQPRWNSRQGKPEKLKRETIPLALCLPQIPHGLTWASIESGWRLTAWAMDWPCIRLQPTYIS